MSEINNKRNDNGFLVITSVILWVISTVLAWGGYWYPGMFLTIILITFLMIAGSKVNGVVDRSFMFFPIGTWCISGLVCLALCEYYARMFAGIPPTFLILGMHPSFAFLVIMWFIQALSTSFGIYLYKDKWLSEERWNDYIVKIQQMNNELV